MTRRPRVWHLFVLFVLSQLSILAITLVAAVLLAAAREQPETFADAGEVEAFFTKLADSPDLLLLSVVVGVAVSVGLALLVGGLSPQPFVERLRVGRPRLSVPELAVASLGFLGLSNASDALLRLLPGYAQGGIAELNRLFQGRSGTELWMVVVLVGIAAPLGEELFYRGALQTRFAERFGRTGGLVVASIAFALAHFEPIHMLFALAAGLYLGWLCDLAGSCRASLAAHAVNNIVATVGADWMASVERGLSTGPIAAASGLLAAASVIWLLRRAGERPSAAIPDAGG